MSFKQRNWLSVRSICDMFTIVFIFFLMFQPSLQKRRKKSIDDDLRIHLQSEIGMDSVSVPTTRYYEIYSRTTGMRVQMKGKRVNANGTVGSKYAKFAFQSYSFGGHIVIKGVHSKRYLCMNKRGRLIGRKIKKRVNKLCVFTERLTELYYDIFSNLRHPSWYVAFKKNGKPKRGDRTAIGEDEILFMKLPLAQRKGVSPRLKFPQIIKIWKEIREGYINRTYRGAMSGKEDTVQFPGDDVGAAVSTSAQRPMSDQPAKRDYQLEIRRNITRILTGELEITLPPSGIYTTAVEFSSRGAKKNKRKNKKKGGKRRNRKKSSRRSKMSKNKDLSTNLEGKGTLEPREVATHPERPSDPPTIPSLLKNRRTTVSEHARRNRTKTSKKRSKARRQRNNKKRNRT